MYQLNIPPDRESLSATQRRTSVTRAPKSPVVGVNSHQPQPQVRQLPQNSAPAWLTSLLAVQKGAAIVFCSVLGLSVIVYGHTARTQDTWKAQHKQLKRFQTQEHQQAVIAENIKQDLAQQAQQPESGLVDPSPKQMVFITGAPQRPIKAPASPASAAPKSKLPLGY
ncbi:hypothetical protein [Chamaesiphon sp. OTE_20_metabat_361]|uniref:hypothetical protein n=1 Tax=Chamaesiphon sp. OTE_20_metabat_361 TaxID=2964689 RepID=UPI00286A966C|nr:hypothetical protein [Chamaesiphon sp. OTE_20_metabat_361]